MMNIQKELQQLSAGEADMRFNNVDVASETGQNILIEKSKFEMASEDISMMYRLINNDLIN